jgi:microcystin-dependent protein
MATDSGNDFPTKIPSFSDDGDIQLAQQQLLYGTSDPQSVRGTLKATAVTDSTQGLVGHINATVNPTGSVIAFAGSTAPVGWRLCNGDPLDKNVAEFANLFTIINYSYGGSDPLFNVPNLKGSVIVGHDPSNTDEYELDQLGNKGTAGERKVVDTNVPTHTHNTPLHYATPQFDLEGLNTDGQSNYWYVWGEYATDQLLMSHGPANNDPSVSHNNMQPYTVLNYIIRL